MNALSMHARWLDEARKRCIRNDMRMVRAFDAGYVLLLRAAQRTGTRTPYEHPNALTLKVGSRALGGTAADTKAGLRLLKWAELDRYAFAPPPLTLQEAIGWATRVKALFVKRCVKAKV